jgi:hypothetical protein
LDVGVDHVNFSSLEIRSKAGSERASPLAQAEESKIGVDFRWERRARLNWAQRDQQV